MRICRINRGSLKVFLCRDMHGAALLRRIASNCTEAESLHSKRQGNLL